MTFNCPTDLIANNIFVEILLPVKYLLAIRGNLNQTLNLYTLIRQDITIMYQELSYSENICDSAFKHRVALICMPFGAANIPSIQIGLLKSVLEQSGFRADTHHLNLELAAKIGPDTYDFLCYHRGHMTGEWLFSIAAFGSQVNIADEPFYTAFPDELKWIQEKGIGKDFLSELRHKLLPDFIAECIGNVDWSLYDLVAFSSTFQQNVACLALAKQFKEKYPTLKIAFGGANMEGGMGFEFAKSFPFIDYIMVGEGDIVFPKLLSSLYRSQPGPDPSIPGLIIRKDESLKDFGQASPFLDLETSPTPNYDEYFNRIESLSLSSHSGILPFESSRGCWWGQKSHCTFCGLNGHGMAYRSKSPQKVLTELSELSNKYGIKFFGAVDNILDMEYIDKLFPVIHQSDSEYRFFYEVKANLTANHIEKLYYGGVRDIQPGIESLSTNILNLMRKGTTMLLNVRILKWCHFYHMNILWNLLWGFPGEKAEDYQRELEVLQLISHLPPPRRCGRVWVERFSPLFTHKEDFGLRNLRPEKSYQYAYPSTVDLEEIAYFFDYQIEDTIPDEAHLKTMSCVKQWQVSWDSGSQDSLVYERTGDVLVVEDHRSIAQQSSYTLAEPLASIYETCCETIRNPKAISQELETKNITYNQNIVTEALDYLCSSGLMLSEGNLYFSLALPKRKNWSISF